MQGENPKDNFNDKEIRKDEISYLQLKNPNWKSIFTINKDANLTVEGKWILGAIIKNERNKIEAEICWNQRGYHKLVGAVTQVISMLLGGEDHIDQ